MTIVKKTFLVFLLAFIIQLTVISSLVLVGFNVSISRWKDMREAQAYETVIRMLNLDESGKNQDFPGSIIIFNSNMEIIHSNQPRMGNKALHDPVVPVYFNGAIVGYYSIRGSDFDDDLANRALVMTMSRILFIALGVSLVVSILAAFYFSKTISRPADLLALQLKKMSSGNMEDAIILKGDTELMQIGKAIEELRGRLLHEKDLRAQWGQDIAHDLRTPVASIRAQLEGMSDNVLSPSKVRFEAMLNELLRIGTLINDFETLMVLESPEILVHTQIVSLERLANTFAERFSHLFLEKNLTFKQNLDIKEIECDESLVMRAISNLILNACHYSDANSIITLASFNHQEGKAISVHNWGLVITEEEKARIFDRLYRGEFARQTPGSGLGLTIVFQIAQLHKAKIYVESSQEQGTLFTLIFP